MQHNTSNTFSQKIANIFIIFIALYFLHITNAINHFFLSPVVSFGEKTAIKVHPGETISSVSTRLSQQGVIKNPMLFEQIALLTTQNGNLRYGEYQIKYPTTAWQLLGHMKQGIGLVKHRFTIVNGWTFDNIRTALSNEHDFKQTILPLTNAGVMQSLQSTQAHAEGMFYPDTYFYTWGNSDLSILKTAYQKMQRILQTQWQNRAPNLPYTNAYQALIVASLIERETSVDAEKPIIASVILNRLQKNMRLQIDPTVLYGISKTFVGPITKNDLKTNTPYNTYLIIGLPPTPICMPSESSIYAALHPAQTDYLYYVATGTGGHNFSATYSDHENQVKEYKETIRNVHKITQE